jgi:hypothetical protein
VAAADHPRIEQDHEYLTEGGVFTPDLIETWISHVRCDEGGPLPSLLITERRAGSAEHLIKTGSNGRSIHRLGAGQPTHRSSA